MCVIGAVSSCILRSNIWARAWKCVRYRLCVVIWMMNVAIIIRDDKYQITSAGMRAWLERRWKVPLSTPVSRRLRPFLLSFARQDRAHCSSLFSSHRHIASSPLRRLPALSYRTALWRHWTLYDVVPGALIRENRGLFNGDARSHQANVCPIT